MNESKLVWDPSELQLCLDLYLEEFLPAVNVNWNSFPFSLDQDFEKCERIVKVAIEIKPEDNAIPPELIHKVDEPIDSVFNLLETPPRVEAQLELPISSTAEESNHEELRKNAILERNRYLNRSHGRYEFDLFSHIMRQRVEHPKKSRRYSFPYSPSSNQRKKSSYLSKDRNQI